ncbi:5'-deoxynucleotidase [Butyrivibrio sp. AE2032]|uniref:5'-deoxynucleotidase n=1 Tax=Butyrivibrio sp. AE2032 TaxID=1458463 RepID=UPI00054E52E6|nr:5'-deoxynucleotidase [Butyrivibrio sp. AE2032]
MDNKEEYGFFAMLDRMQYIGRWALMRNSRTENIKEHSFDVAVIAHCLTLLHNKFEKDKEGAILPDPYKVQAYALYHDCTEILTGDLPTPIKYRNKEITKAYKEVEKEAAASLVELLPDDEEMRAEYMELLAPDITGEEQILIHKLVKAADKIAAYIKCLREESTGNAEFSAAKEATGKTISEMDMPEVRYYMEHFVPSYGYTLDKITGRDT